MNVRGIRWPVVAATMAVTLGLLLGIGFVLKTQTVDTPLKALYASSPAVAASTIERQDEGYKITVQMKDVPDLAAAYAKLDQETAKLMKGLPYTIAVEDQRSEQLEQAYRRVNLYVQEALTTGRFADMADRAEAEAAKAGLTARIGVDNDRVYVQMHDKTGYLYSVVNRTPVDATKVQRVEGGISL
ncbi:MAG TPA: hypothetical protein VK464_20370 [Symbiobacteriaceae bacterium]|jgi:hypothetical protein|nr:hypothetical protein [Symbiobacteriaceae bacterium]